MSNRKYKAPIYVIGPSIAYIPLTRGYFATVDTEDAEYLSRYTWRLDKRPNKRTMYAARPAGPIFRMHQLLSGNGADHINRNGLHNFRGNLRPASPVEQMRNRRHRVDNKTGVNGVCFAPSLKKWVFVFRSGKVRLRKDCATFEEAVALRIAAEKQYYGEFAPR